jgi:hypothetical protein
MPTRRSSPWRRKHPDMKGNKTNKMLVVARDAGGAEIIAGYMLAHAHDYNFISCVCGPAEVVFSRESIPYSQLSETKEAIAKAIQNNSDAAWVLLGTKWHTETELIALREAKKKKMHTIAYLESWVNYRERFGFPSPGWEADLPDEIWVGDSAALEMARELFPTAITLRLVPNEYFAKTKKKYQSLRREEDANKIVFLGAASHDSPKSLSLLIEAMRQINAPRDILVRFHPSDDRSWFYASEALRNNEIIDVSDSSDLAYDLARAIAVVGPETSALAAATLCGIPAASFIATGSTRMIPFPDIHLATDVRDLSAFLWKAVGCGRQ